MAALVTVEEPQPNHALWAHGTVAALPDRHPRRGKIAYGAVVGVLAASGGVDAIPGTKLYVDDVPATSFFAHGKRLILHRRRQGLG